MGFDRGQQTTPRLRSECKRLTGAVSPTRTCSGWTRFALPALGSGHEGLPLSQGGCAELEVVRGVGIGPGPFGPTDCGQQSSGAKSRTPIAFGHASERRAGAGRGATGVPIRGGHGVATALDLGPVPRRVGAEWYAGPCRPSGGCGDRRRAQSTARRRGRRTVPPDPP